MLMLLTLWYNECRHHEIASVDTIILRLSILLIVHYYDIATAEIPFSGSRLHDVRNPPRWLTVHGLRLAVALISDRIPSRPMRLAPVAADATVQRSAPICLKETNACARAKAAIARKSMEFSWAERFEGISVEHAGKSSGGFAMAESGRRTGCVRTQVQPVEATPPARQPGQSDGDRAASLAWKDREYSADDLSCMH